MRNWPGWPGESAAIQEVREQPERVAGYGIDDIVRHYAEIARTLGAPPIVIGTRSAGSSRSGCSVRTSRRPPS